MKPIFKKTVATLLLSSFVGGQAWAATVRDTDILYDCTIKPVSRPSLVLQMQSFNYTSPTFQTFRVDTQTFDNSEQFVMVARPDSVTGISNWFLVSRDHSHCIGLTPGVAPLENSQTEAKQCESTDASIMSVKSIGDGSYAIRPKAFTGFNLSVAGASSSGGYQLQWRHWNSLSNAHQRWTISCLNITGQPVSPA